MATLLSMTCKGIRPNRLHILKAPWRNTLNPFGRCHMTSSPEILPYELQMDWTITEGEEVLVSVSEDGRVVRWSFQKGFEPTEMMKLRSTQKKRQQSDDRGSKTPFISRLSGGTCMALNPSSDGYLVGALSENAAAIDQVLSRHRRWEYPEVFDDIQRSVSGDVRGSLWICLCCLLVSLSFRFVSELWS